jgi:hypothetical protein
MFIYLFFFNILFKKTSLRVTRGSLSYTHTLNAQLTFQRRKINNVRR